jgi:hypothetical protein
MTTAMGGSGAERRGEAERRRRPATCALFWCYSLHRNARRWPARAGRSRSEAETRSGAERE